MVLELVTVIIDDYDPAIDFFTAALGFDLVEDAPAVTSSGGPKRWVVVRPPGGRTGILLARADGPDQERAVGRQFAGRVGLFLRVADLDASLRRLRDHGAEIVREARAESYGRVAVFRDPWGNTWDLLGRAPGGS